MGYLAFGGGGKTDVGCLTSVWGRFLKDVFTGAAPHNYYPGAGFGIIGGIYPKICGMAPTKS
jgi:hypothetical protein